MSTITITPGTAITTPRRVVSEPTPRPVRLTRRGRLVVLMAGLLIVAVVSIVWGAGSAATDQAGQPAPTRVVVVESGDTLWGIADAATDEADVRSVVDRIVELNDLPGGVVHPGQRLRVPVGD